MRISVWSSDVCSSDLSQLPRPPDRLRLQPGVLWRGVRGLRPADAEDGSRPRAARLGAQDEPEGNDRRYRPVLLRAVRHVGPGGGAGRLICAGSHRPDIDRSEEHTSELQSLMRISYDGFCLKK